MSRAGATARHSVSDDARRQSRPLSLLNPPGLYDPTANGYSHLASIAAGSPLVYVAGQGAETEDGALLGEGPKPSCTLIPVPRLAIDGMLFEVEAVAVLPA